MPAMMLAEVPPGMSAGSQFIVRAPNGQQVMVTLPPVREVADVSPLTSHHKLAVEPILLQPNEPSESAPRVHWLRL